ncbi:MAG: energy transducer TonB [Saprospiraceae bacterium]|nr:energy transducer TonB [Saprospiraceae bacterium]
MLRKPLVLVLSLFAYTLLLAQPDSLPDKEADEEANSVIQADQMPYFRSCTSLPDGSVEKRNCSNQSLVSFISKNLEIPQKSEETGAVYITFSVDERGKIIDPSILRGLSKEQNDAALSVVKAMPDWEPARLNNQPIKVQMTLPIRFMRKDESEFSNGFQLTWGNLKGSTIDREALNKYLLTPITVRDETGNSLEINELSFEREHGGKYSEAQSNGMVTTDMRRIVKKLRRGDRFTVTATVQKKGHFFYVDKSFSIN